MKAERTRRALIGALVLLLVILLGTLFAVPELRGRLKLLAGLGEEPFAGVDLDAPIGGPFTLVDEQGRTVRDSDFRGRYMLVFFGYASCPDVCPLTLLNVTRGLESFRRDDPARAALVQPVFITVDPKRDTPEALRAFHQNFDPEIVMLTGAPAAIARVAAEYGVEFRKVEDPRVSGYLMEHTAFLFLMDRQGNYLTHLPSDAQAGLIRLALDNWVCRIGRGAGFDADCLKAARTRLSERRDGRAADTPAS